MIFLNNTLQLKPIVASDVTTLQHLMSEIYPPAYKHFWKDGGKFYVENQYSKENILKELLQENAIYFFVIFNNEIIGNFRIIWDEKLVGLNEKKHVKLHRIYLHQKIQGNGIGKQLVAWLEKTAKDKNYNLIWLDAMNSQPQAFQFYKKLGYNYHSHIFLNFELMLDDVRKMSQIYKKI